MKTKKLSVLITLVALIGTFTASLPLIVIEANAGGPTVEMEVNVPPFCGLGFIDPVDGILTFPTTINFAVSDPQSVILRNTGNGAGEVFISGSSVLHNPQTFNLVGDWLDDNGGFLWEVFRTRFASADIDYTLMTSVFFISQTFIEILDGQDQAERILKVRPFDQTGQDNVLGHQIMDLEINCTPARSCLEGQLIFNGDCVNRCPVSFIPDAENRKCVPLAECVGTPAICDDGNICTADVCDEIAGCSNPAVPDGSVSQSCYTGPAGTQDVGVCLSGLQTCQAGSLGVCSGDKTPSTEVCDGLDNDCNGQVDETFDFDFDINNCGFCGNECSGLQTCLGGICGVT